MDKRLQLTFNNKFFVVACKEAVIGPSPHFLHWSLMLDFSLLSMSFKRRFHLRKADWNKFADEVAKELRDLLAFQ